MAPKVSLYIPCYDAKKYIAACLDGVFKQTYPIDEVLVVDDGPGDDTAKIAGGYPVTVIRRQGKLGLPSARNLAFRNARNEFVAALDADCVAEPDWLERLMDNFSAEDIAGVGGMAIEKYNIRVADRWRAVHMKQLWGNKKIISPPYLYGLNSVFRKSIVAEVGYFNEEKCSKSFEDGDISERIKQRGYKLVYEPAAIVYHMRQDSIPSMLKACWTWRFLGRGANTPPDKLWNICLRTYDRLVALLFALKDDLVLRWPDFVPIDILVFFGLLFLDLKYYIKTRGRK
jgi:glycosyltransferase involved in cell wall biosynthesis